jgi:hypothetical protein
MRLPSRFRYWDPDSLAYRFFAEAKRLWELQGFRDDHRNLLSAQVAMLMNVIYSLCALDKIGSVFAMKSLAIAKDLRLFDGNASIKPKRVQNARNFSAWALFNADMYVILNIDTL